MVKGGIEPAPCTPSLRHPPFMVSAKEGVGKEIWGQTCLDQSPTQWGGPMSTCRTAVAESPRAVLPPTPSLQGDVGLGGLGCSHLAPLTPTSRASVPHSRGCCLAFHSRACLEVLTIVTYLSPMPLIVLKVVILIIIIMTVFS